MEKGNNSIFKNDYLHVNIEHLIKECVTLNCFRGHGFSWVKKLNVKSGNDSETEAKLGPKSKESAEKTRRKGVLDFHQ